MLYAKAKELRETRAGLVAQAQKLLTASERLSPETETKFDALMAEADRLKTEIDRVERLIATEQELNQRIDQRAGREDITVSQARADSEREREVFRNWMLRGMVGLSEEERRFMQERQVTIRAAQGVGTGAAGGFLVPEGFRAVLESALKAFGGMREVATPLDTDSGESIPMPTENDTGNVGELLAENTATAEQDITFGSVTIDAFMYSSKLVRVSIQLMQDSAFDMEGFLARKLAERIARITNTHFTTGTGTGQPRGLVTAAPVGKTGATGQTTSIIYDDLVDLEHSVDPAYRRNGGWMLHDSSLKVVKKLKDSQNRPLWMPGLAVQAPDTILGYRYVINQDVPVMAANAKSVLFGDLSKYLIRSVRQVILKRLEERYAELLQIGFIAFQRFDGDLIDAGTNPVKHYANSAT